MKLLMFQLVLGHWAVCLGMTKTLNVEVVLVRNPVKLCMVVLAVCIQLFSLYITFVDHGHIWRSHSIKLSKTIAFICAFYKMFKQMNSNCRSQLNPASGKIVAWTGLID